MTPELKAFRRYQKNRDLYLDEALSFFGNDEKLFEHYSQVAALFGADPGKLMKLRRISYERSVERAFR